MTIEAQSRRGRLRSFAVRQMPTLLPLFIRLSAVVRLDRVMWTVFVLVNLMLVLLAPYGTLGDVLVYYQPWAHAAVDFGQWPSITTPWVYPVAAILPMLVPLLLGPENYAFGWLLMVQLLNAGAFWLILRKQRDNGRWLAGWWWLLFITLLGPIALTRLDSVAVPIAIAGLVFAGSRPAAATALLTLATWIKVWPAVLVGALFLSRPQGAVVRVATFLSAGLLLLMLALGAGANAMSFTIAHSGRGVEVGSPLATTWLWLTLGGTPGADIYFSHDIQAFEVTGPGIEIGSLIVGFLMAAALTAVVVLAWRARLRLASPAELLTTASLALLTATIAFNKVGSPQFVAMIAVPIVVAIAAGQRRFAAPAALAAAIALMTHMLFPWYFLDLLNAVPWVLALVTLRNLAMLALFAWCVVELARMPARVAALDS